MSFVIEGSLAAPGGASYAAGDIVGGLELLAGRPSPADVRAVTRTKALRLDAEDLFDVLDDNFGLLVATLRAFAGLAIARPQTSVDNQALDTSDPLGLVDRLLLLRRQAPFAGARIRALTSLAHASTEMTWPSGTTVVRAGELATSSYIIVEGSARASSSAEMPPLRAGNTLGLLETLAGHSHPETLEAVTLVRALASPQAALLDVLEDHSDLGFAVLATLAADILDQTAGAGLLPGAQGLRD